MATLEKMSQKEMIAKIRDLESTPPVMIGTDTGTHGKPGYHYIYETITGEKYAMYSFAGSNKTRCTVEQAEQDTDGRIRVLTGNQDRIRAAQADLKAARKLLAKMER